jgi:integrase/recombinase XerD
VTPLRQRLLDELPRRHYTSDTIRGYVHAVEEFACYFGKSPERLGAEEIREFQLHLIREKKLAPGTVALRMGALRLLYKKTLRRRDLDLEDLPLVRAPRKLPVVLSPEEVARLLEGALNLWPRTMLLLLYATGLRRAEAAHLQISDSDSALMLIHVHQGQGSRDRKLPLTPKLLAALRPYGRACQHKPQVYLFPRRVEPIQPERPLSDQVIWTACHAAARHAGLSTRIGPPTAAPSFCDTLAGSRHRPAHDSSSAGTSKTERHSGLSPCLPPASASRHESAGSDLATGLFS